MGNRKIQNVLAAVLILLALLALFFQHDIQKSWQEYNFVNDRRPTIAKIESINNDVKYRLPESLVYHDARNAMPLHAKDTVSTGQSSTAVVSFNNGLKVELQPNSLIIVEDYTGGGGSIELSFLQGNVKVLNEGEGSQVKLKGTSVNREDAAAAAKAKEDAAIKLDLAMLEKAPTPPPANALRSGLEEKKEKAKPTPSHRRIEDRETLPDSYIASIIRNQRTFLNRCYAQHLRLNPDARGRIDTSLTIEPDGTISTARVIGSTIPDPALQQCVVTTLQRARFKAFNGDPIIVTYPINFE